LTFSEHPSLVPHLQLVQQRRPHTRPRKECCKSALRFAPDRSWTAQCAACPPQGPRSLWAAARWLCGCPRHRPWSRTRPPPTRCPPVSVRGRAWVYKRWVGRVSRAAPLRVPRGTPEGGSRVAPRAAALSELRYAADAGNSSPHGWECRDRVCAWLMSQVTVWLLVQSLCVTQIASKGWPLSRSLGCDYVAGYLILLRCRFPPSSSSSFFFPPPSPSFTILLLCPVALSPPGCHLQVLIPTQGSSSHAHHLQAALPFRLPICTSPCSKPFTVAHHWAAWAQGAACAVLNVVWPGPFSSALNLLHTHLFQALHNLVSLLTSENAGLGQRPGIHLAALRHQGIRHMRHQGIRHMRDMTHAAPRDKAPRDTTHEGRFAASPSKARMAQAAEPAPGLHVAAADKRQGPGTKSSPVSICHGLTHINAAICVHAHTMYGCQERWHQCLLCNIWSVYSV